MHTFEHVSVVISPSNCIHTLAYPGTSAGRIQGNTMVHITTFVNSVILAASPVPNFIRS